MLAAKIGDRHAGLMLLQNPDDLLFRKAAALHVLVLVVASPRGKVTSYMFAPKATKTDLYKSDDEPPGG
jgi:hypothetical protein